MIAIGWFLHALSNRFPKQVEHRRSMSAEIAREFSG